MLQEVPIIFYKSKLKSFLLFLGCLVFVLMALFVNKTNEVWYWVCLILFGLGSIVFLIQLIFPKSSFLRITEKGIEVRSLYRTSFMPWEIIDHFEVGTIPAGIIPKKMVMIFYDESYKKQNFGRNIAKSLSGFEGGLSDNYGMEHNDLAKILNAYKDRFKQN